MKPLLIISKLNCSYFIIGDIFTLPLEIMDLEYVNILLGDFLSSIQGSRTNDEFFLTFQPLIVIFRRVNFVYHYLGYTYILRPLSYPLRTLVLCRVNDSSNMCSTLHSNILLQLEVAISSMKKKHQFSFVKFSILTIEFFIKTEY